MRREKNIEYQEDNSDFWYDIRNSVRNALPDLCLVSDIAEQKQLKMIFSLDSLSTESEDQELKEDKGIQSKSIPNISLVGILKSIFEPLEKEYVADDEGRPCEVVSSKEDYLWKAQLARQIIRVCLNFFIQSGLIVSKTHLRIIEETNDVIASDIGRAPLRHAAIIKKRKKKNKSR